MLAPPLLVTSSVAANSDGANSTAAEHIRNRSNRSSSVATSIGKDHRPSARSARWLEWLLLLVRLALRMRR